MVFVNSTWTYNHIASLWKYAAYRKRIRIIYPPCSLPSSSNDELKADSSDTTIDDQRQPIILSIGQFRPEKDHTLQIEAMAKYLRKHHPTSIAKESNSGASSISNNNNDKDKENYFPKLVLIGSCRNDADQGRLETLQQLCRTLQISKHVQFVVNEPFAIVQQYLYQSTIGIHTVCVCVSRVFFFLQNDAPTRPTSKGTEVLKLQKLSYRFFQILLSLSAYFSDVE